MLRVHDWESGFLEALKMARAIEGGMIEMTARIAKVHFRDEDDKREQITQLEKENDGANCYMHRRIEEVTDQVQAAAQMAKHLRRKTSILFQIKQNGIGAPSLGGFVLLCPRCWL